MAIYYQTRASYAFVLIQIDWLCSHIEHMAYYEAQMFPLHSFFFSSSSPHHSQVLRFRKLLINLSLN